MPGFSDYVEDQIRAHIFRTGTFTKPTALWIALHTADPTDAGTGAEVSTSGTGYGRVQRDPSDANWTAVSATDGKTANAAVVTFGTPSGSWGTVTHMGIWDASTGGNLIASGPLALSKTIGATDPAPSFAVGALSVTFALLSDYLNQQVRAHLFRTASFAKPSALWVALHTADPGNGGTGAEVSGGAYARAQHDPADANWTAASLTDGLTTNAAALIFPAPSGADWGRVSHVGIWDAEIAGNLIARGALSTARVVNDGDAAPFFAAGNVSVAYV